MWCMIYLAESSTPWTLTLIVANKQWNLVKLFNSLRSEAFVSFSSNSLLNMAKFIMFSQKQFFFSSIGNIKSSLSSKSIIFSLPPKSLSARCLIFSSSRHFSSYNWPVSFFAEDKIVSNCCISFFSNLIAILYELSLFTFTALTIEGNLSNFAIYCDL